MRLINTHTFKPEDHVHEDMRDEYAILSHTWGADEVTFQEYSSGCPSMQQKKGYRKIEYTCLEAVKDGISYAWVDTW